MNAVTANRRRPTGPAARILTRLPGDGWFGIEAVHAAAASLALTPEHGVALMSALRRAGAANQRASRWQLTATGRGHQSRG